MREGGRDVYKNGELHAHPFEPATLDDPSRGLHLDDLRKALDAALGRLSPKLRVTFVLFAEAGLSYKEIAVDQQIPIGTAKTRLRTALLRLRAELSPAGANDD